MTGVDLSHYQEGLDMSLLKSGGYEFAIIKISEGRTIADASFDRFYNVAKANKIPIGAYVFSHAVTPSVAQEEALYAVNLLKGRELELGIFMDVETEGQMQITKSQLKETVASFLRTVRQAGYKSGIYGSEYRTWARIEASDFESDNVIWIAHYGKKPEIRCDIWQKTDSGRVPGYYGNVDLDEAMSERFLQMVKSVGKAENKEQDKPKVQSKWDWKIAEIQFVMQCDGYWGDVDGQYSEEFIEAFFEYGRGIETVWTGKTKH